MARAIRFKWTWPTWTSAGSRWVQDPLIRKRIQSAFYRRIDRAPAANEINFTVNTNRYKQRITVYNWVRVTIHKQYPSNVWPVTVEFT